MLDEANIKQMLALYNAGRFADMESIARSVLPMAPNSPLLNELLGIALSAQNRNAEALNFLEAATRYAPRDPQFWENLGLPAADWRVYLSRSKPTVCIVTPT